MTAEASTESSASLAAGILREIFTELDHGFTVRLWDGSEILLGRDVHDVIVVFPSARAFKRILLNLTSSEFAEAYVEGDIDLLGDLFEVMKVGDSIDEIDLSFWEKIKFGMRIKRISE